jgi:hypothetical protein
MDWSTSTVICGNIIAAIRGMAIYQCNQRHGNLPICGPCCIVERWKSRTLFKWSLERSDGEMNAILHGLPSGENITIKRG